MTPTLGLLRALPHLRTLGLDRIPISNADARLLGSLVTLETLTLRGSSITDAGISELVALPRIVQLTVEDTATGDAGCARIASSASIEVVNVSRTRVTSACISALARATSLRELYANGISSRSQELSLAPQSRIEVLAMDDVRWDDGFVPALLALRSLRSVSHPGPRLSARGRKRLGDAGIAILRP